MLIKISHYAKAASHHHQSAFISLPIDNTSTSVTLTPAAVPTGTGVKLYLFQIEFYQEVNGVQYALKNGAYNALSIIDVV